MKILLDENLPTKVKYDFGENFETWTVKDIDNKHQTLQPFIEKVKALLNGPDIPKLSEISFD